MFCQRTSIRGIPKIENSKLSPIKWFWVIFILCAFAAMFTLCVLLIGRYYRFDTTMKISNNKVGYRDFPEITICSKRFFDSGKEEFPNPYVFLNNYGEQIRLQVESLVTDFDIDQAIKIIKNQFTTAAFFHDNFNFIQQRTLFLVNKLRNSCNISTGGRSSKNNKVFCNIKAIYNPLYLNCLAFGIPKNIPMNKSTKFKMEINIEYLKKPKNLFLDTFKMDEYISDNTEDDGFSENRVYINSVDDYPFDFDFEAPINCLTFNNYIVEATQQQYYFVEGPSATCRNTIFIANSYGAKYSSTRETLCNSLLIQRNVWIKCQCFLDSLPNNETLYSMTNLCVSNDTNNQCAEDVISAVQESVTNECLPFCTKTDYDITYKSKPFYASEFSEQMDEMLDTADECKDIADCQINANCIAKTLFENTTNVVCPNPTTFTTSSSTSSVSASETVCEKISLKLELRPKMKIFKESLVVEFNTLLSQTGGMCAFVTGLTITFIAEVIEIFIFWINDKLASRKVPD